MKGTVTLICHLSNAIVKWPNCPLVPRWGQLFGTVPRMTKESDVEAEGFCILMIYLALLLFSRSVHRHNVSGTKALLTLTIWPSDPCCRPTRSLFTDSDTLIGQCKVCRFKIKQNKNNLFPFFILIKPIRRDSTAFHLPLKSDLWLTSNFNVSQLEVWKTEWFVKCCGWSLD